MDEATFAWVRVAAFALAALPALVSNLRSGAIPNRDSAIVLLGGIAVVVAERLLGLADGALPLLFWGFAFVALFALFATRILPGGVAKLTIAMLPWFDDAMLFVAAFGLGFLVTALAGYRRGAEVKAVPGLYLAAVGALALAAA